MKKNKIIYLITVWIIFLGVSLPEVIFYNNPASIEGFKTLGFPEYFRIELLIAKFLGGLALILPMVPRRIKEWAYVGFAIDFSSAIIAVWAVAGVSQIIFPLIALIVLIVSYTYFNKVNSQNSIVPNATV